MTDQESGFRRIRFPFGFHAPVKIKKPFMELIDFEPRKRADLPPIEEDEIPIEKLLD